MTEARAEGAVSLDLDGDGVARVTISSPATRNALSYEVQRALSDAIERANEDGARAVILAGDGGVFASGADLRELAERSEWTTYESLAQRTFATVERSAAPVIAEIAGYALGGGLELALACHLRVASTTAKLGFPEVSLGILPGAGGTQRLTAVLGRARAMELILTARTISGRRAHEIGLVSEVVDEAELGERTNELARRLAANAPNAVRLAKDAVLLASETSAGLAFERAAQALLFTQPDRRERIEERLRSLAER